jgi:hypothetical protein
MIRVELERKGKTGIKGTIVLPEGLYGNFIWDNYSYPLIPGTKEINL